ncbi:guanine nucleotide-binding protein alpha subunit [Mycena vitilis]|nr:guanine nucleotide-binding protein alpha subunit [Mycena vitilis]
MLSTLHLPTTMVARTHDIDPFSVVLRPPPNETPAERQQRVALEQEQKRISDQIDDDLRKERAERKKRAKREVKLLLLGQSESGKSTVLKNFRLKYAPSQWKAELRSWRAVIQLNLIQNVITILDVLQARLAAMDSPTDSASSYGRASMDSTSDTLEHTVVLTQSHRLLNLRLSPLREVGEDLRRRLGAADPEFTFANGSDGTMNVLPEEGPVRTPSREFGVRGWIDALGLPIHSTKKSADFNEPMAIDEPTEILATVRDDIIALWADPDVRALLHTTGMRVEDTPGFFLSDTARITSRDYVPSDTDVVRARLRTLGVQEWRIMLEQNNSFGSEWVIYDVGGSRSMRHAWLPYFDAIDAIIFLAPISCFDERLAEDPTVNRLEDTLHLWRAIVSSPLLKKTTLVVFLNKCDLLKRKLQSGIQVNQHLVSFGNRPNEVSAVVKYLKDKFKDIIRAHTAGPPRSTYLYATSVTDTKATAATLNTVRDGILREHLNHAELV